jgi:hypothetical protein
MGVLVSAHPENATGEDASIKLKAAIPTAISDQAHPSIDSGFVSKIAAAGFGGFIGWLLTKIVTLIVLRKRLIAYLVVVINGHMDQYRETKKWLEAVKDKTIKKNHVIKLAATYHENDMSDLADMRSDCLQLLKKSELIKTTKLHQRMLEIEDLLAGFCEDLTNYRKNGTTLSESSVDYLQKKIERIKSYMDKFPLEKIQTLDQLPDDYAGVHGADVLVSNSSAVEPSKPRTEESSPVLAPVSRAHLVVDPTQDD